MRRTSKVRQYARARGFRSGLEGDIALQFTERGLDGQYEKRKLTYTRPATTHTYTADFWLHPKLAVETKGYFSPEDRKKHLLIRECNPDIEIRFVFDRASTKIRKGSKTSYGDWCKKHGFKYAEKRIPEDWFKEV